MTPIQFDFSNEISYSKTCAILKKMSSTEENIIFQSNTISTPQFGWIEAVLMKLTKWPKMTNGDHKIGQIW